MARRKCCTQSKRARAAAAAAVRYYLSMSSLKSRETRIPGNRLIARTRVCVWQQWARARTIITNVVDVVVVVVVVTQVLGGGVKALKGLFLSVARPPIAVVLSPHNTLADTSPRSPLRRPVTEDKDAFAYATERYGYCVYRVVSVSQPFFKKQKGKNIEFSRNILKKNKYIFILTSYGARCFRHSTNTVKLPLTDTSQ